MCSRCVQPVRVPPVTDTDNVRCPICGEVFSVADLHIIDPPLLGVVAVGPQPVNAADSDEHNRKSPSPTLIIPNTFDEVSIATHQIHVKSPASLHAGRRKQSTGSQLGLLKVIVGGIAGLALGQLILWWLPKPYSTDPLQLAPKLPSFVAFLAPPQHRNGMEFDSASAALAPQDNHKQSAWDATEEVHRMDGETQLAGKPDVRPKGPDALLGFVDESLIGLEELRQRLNAAIAADKAFANPSMPPTYRDKWYLKLRELAFAVTFADTSEPEIGLFANDVREFISKFAQEQWKTELVGKLAADTFDDKEQHRQGIVISGRVTEIGPAGRRFQTLIKLSGQSDRVLEVVSSKDPQNLRAYEHGDRVIILGTIVHDPNLYLLGYEGNAECVIVGGLPQRLPAP